MQCNCIVEFMTITLPFFNQFISFVFCFPLVLFLVFYLSKIKKTVRKAQHSISPINNERNKNQGGIKVRLVVCITQYLLWKHTIPN